MERIVFIERNTVQANFRRPTFEHEWVEYPESFAGQVNERIRDATIIISNKLSLGRAATCRCARREIDCDSRRRVRTAWTWIIADGRGITVCNVRGYAANSVPETRAHADPRFAAQPAGISRGPFRQGSGNSRNNFVC
jgi:glycerate dehydrogenase